MDKNSRSLEFEIKPILTVYDEAGNTLPIHVEWNNAQIEVWLELGFEGLVRLVHNILERRYSDSVFTGVSGDQGPRFIVKLREALAILEESPEKQPGYMGDVNGPGCDPDVP